MGHATDRLALRWDDAVIPYEIDESFYAPGSDGHTAIMAAIDHWNQLTVVALVPRTQQDDRVVFTRESGGDEGWCNSAVGRQGGRQQILCGSDEADPATIAHEIGHAVGLLHEHQRSDRDEFVTIQWDNIEPAHTDAFELEKDELLIGDYDYESIMHYERNAAAVRRRSDTITPLQDVEIGLGTGLSPHDVWAVSTLYPETNHPVVFQDDRDGNGRYQIMLAGFNFWGRRSIGDVVVNSIAQGQQQRPAVGMDANGGIVVAWQDDRGEDGMYQIRARGFEADGAERFTDITVNKIARGQQRDPEIGVAADGSFVVAWEDDVGDDGRYQVKLAAFEPDGTPRFSKLASVATSDARNPDVAVAPNGSFVVVYQEDRERRGTHEVRARPYNARGARQADFIVNENRVGEQRRPRVAMGPGGGFVVAWEDDVGRDGFYQIKASGFNEAGTPRFGPIVVNEHAQGQQRRPDVAMSQGDFVVVWQGDRGNDGFYEVKARSFDETGKPLQSYAVNTVRKGQQRRPRVTFTRDSGRFVVAWEEDQDGDGDYEVHVRGFGSGGERFAPRAVNRDAKGSQLRPAICSLAYED